jgi:hypothetical protein
MGLTAGVFMRMLVLLVRHNRALAHRKNGESSVQSSRNAENSWVMRSFIKECMPKSKRITLERFMR